MAHEVAAWICATIPRRARHHDVPVGESPFGLNIAGAIDSEGGVAEATRGYVAAARAVEIPFALNNFRVSRSATLDRHWEAEIVPDHPFGVNLICINGSHIPRFYLRVGSDYFAGRYNIGCWVWELASFPEKWKEVMSLFDEIWAPSTFCAEAFRWGKVHVETIPHVVEPPSVLSSSRSRFGIPEHAFMFLFMFDYYSVFERKNPLAIIAAFKKAFRPGESVVLVIKTVNAEISPYNCAKLKIAAQGASVVFLDQYLSRQQNWELMACCDAYISLHRSEGFGLTLAEAMSLGKPVIATNYSGNTDYMTNENSFPVQYRLTHLPRNFGPYKKGNMWADPDIDQAAEWMRHVYDDPEHAKALGLRASRDIAKVHGPREVGQRINARLEMIRKRFGENNIEAIRISEADHKAKQIVSANETSHTGLR